MPEKLDSTAVTHAENLFREYLRSRDLKYTSERQTLVRAILDTQDHFEPDDLLVNLRQQGIRVGKATIYRTLPLLVDCGILRRAFLGGSRAYYEHALGPVPHDHMVCRRCGRVIEFDSTEVLQLREQLARSADFEAISHRFQILGVCSHCSRSAEDTASK